MKDWKGEVKDLRSTSQLKDELVIHILLLTKRQGRVLLFATAKDGITLLYDGLPMIIMSSSFIKASHLFQLTRNLLVIS